jgi:hypothetical protein
VLSLYVQGMNGFSLKLQHVRDHCIWCICTYRYRGALRLTWGRLARVSRLHFRLRTDTSRHSPFTLINHWHHSRCVNYCNRAGGEVNVSELAASYCLAVAASCGLAVGLGKASKTVPMLKACPRPSSRT